MSTRKKGEEKKKVTEQTQKKIGEGFF